MSHQPRIVSNTGHGSLMLTSSAISMVSSTILILIIVHTRQNRGQIAVSISELATTPPEGQFCEFTSRYLHNQSLLHLRQFREAGALRSQRSDQWLHLVVEAKQECPCAQRLPGGQSLDLMANAVQTSCGGTQGGVLSFFFDKVVVGNI